MSGILDLLRQGVLGLGDAAQKTYTGILNNPAVDKYRMGVGERMTGLLNNPAGFMRDAFTEATPFRSTVPADLIQQVKRGGGELTPEQQEKWLNLALGGMTVYHGSPHRFDKFDSSRIGTGEGAQSYGRGIYLAESPDVALGYQRKLAALQKPNVVDAGLQSLYSRTGDWVSAVDEHMKRIYDTPKAKEKMRASLIKQGPPTNVDGGHLYKVDLPDDQIAKMLDWDKPLSQQSDNVISAIARIQGVEPDIYRQMMKLNPDKFDMTGKNIYTFLQSRATAADERIGSIPMQKVLSDGQVAASQKLKDLGIPGIRYLDGNSRTGGQGTSNFVVFPGNEGILNILERQ